MSVLSAWASFMFLLTSADCLLWRSAEKTPEQLDPVHCTEAALIEPRNLPKPTTLALESAVGVSGLDFITLVHGDENMQSSKALVQDSSLLNNAAARGQLRLLNVHVGDLGGDHEDNKMPTLLEEGVRYHDEYSRLVESPGFWKSMKCDRVVLMQSDSLFCHGSKAHLADFAEYPYIGGETPLMGHTDHRLHMNGGFSLRSRPAMLKCLDKSQQTLEEEETVQEDNFYSICHSLRQPPVELMDKFAIDNAWKMPYEVPLGMHKPWGAGPWRDYNLDKCPGAKALYEAFLEEERKQKERDAEEERKQREKDNALAAALAAALTEKPSSREAEKQSVAYHRLRAAETSTSNTREQDAGEAKISSLDKEEAANGARSQKAGGDVASSQEVGGDAGPAPLLSSELLAGGLPHLGSRQAGSESAESILDSLVRARSKTHADDLDDQQEEDAADDEARDDEAQYGEGEGMAGGETDDGGLDDQQEEGAADDEAQYGETEDSWSD